MTGLHLQSLLGPQSGYSYSTSVGQLPNHCTTFSVTYTAQAHAVCKAWATPGQFVDSSSWMQETQLRVHIHMEFVPQQHKTQAWKPPFWDKTQEQCEQQQ